MSENVFNEIKAVKLKKQKKNSETKEEQRNEKGAVKWKERGRK